MAQEINAYLKDESGVAVIVGPSGLTSDAKTPTLTRAVESLLKLNFIDGKKAPQNVPETIVSWVFVLDNDWKSSTPPLLFVNEGITVSGNVVSIPICANTSPIITLLEAGGEGVASIPLAAELQGYDTEGQPAFVKQFSVNILNLRYYGGAGPSAQVENYYTKSQLDALLVGVEDKIKAANVYQYSADGETWHDAPRVSTDTVYHERKNVEGSLYGESLPLPRAELIIDTKTYSFSTTVESANPLVISKETLGIVADAEPNLSVWLVNADGSKQLAGDSVIPVKSYTADGTGLSLTYYQTTWPAANWQIKMS